MPFRGNVPVLNYYEYQFAGGLLENGAPTYVIEAVIPRSFFGADNPRNGDPIGLRFSPACRNDGNDSEDAPTSWLIAKTIPSSSCSATSTTWTGAMRRMGPTRPPRPALAPTTSC